MKVYHSSNHKERATWQGFAVSREHTHAMWWCKLHASTHVKIAVLDIRSDLLTPSLIVRAGACVHVSVTLLQASCAFAPEFAKYTLLQGESLRARCLMPACPGAYHLRLLTPVFRRCVSWIWDTVNGCTSAVLNYINRVSFNSVCQHTQYGPHNISSAHVHTDALQSLRTFNETSQYSMVFFLQWW